MQNLKISSEFLQEYTVFIGDFHEISRAIPRAIRKIVAQYPAQFAKTFR